MNTYVVGDIHGCVDELAALTAGLPLARGDTLVFLGDYVDRGPSSRSVVDFILSLREERQYDIRCLKGNHEDMLLSFVGLGGNHGDMFLFNGGASTLKSYGLNYTGDPESQSARLLHALPGPHRDFFTNLETYCLLGEFLCVHAGIQPLRALEDQVEEEMLWIREEFIMNPHPLPYTVLFGHTPREEVLFHLPYKVGLDTGLVYGNQLSCLEVTSKTLFQVQRGSRAVTKTPVAHHWRTAGTRG